MPYERVDIPLNAGLSQKVDDKALKPPGLAVAQDVQFDDIGGIQTRPQYQAIVDDAGNTISNIRKIVPYGDELVAFTDTKIYSYASGDGLWIERDEYLAPKVEEKARFVTNGDQYDCDRCEKDGVIFYSWTINNSLTARSYIAAVDAETGTVKLAPQDLGAYTQNVRMLASIATVFVVWTNSNTGDLHVRSYDPTDLSFDTTSQNLTGGENISICSDGAAGCYIATRLSTTSYDLRHCTFDAILDDSASRTTTVSGPIAIAYDPLNEKLVVVFNNGTAVKADVYDGDLTSDSTDTAVGTASSATVNQIDVILTGPGAFDVAWSAGEATDDSDFFTRYNSLTYSGSLSAGTDTAIVRRCGLASKLFRHNGESFVWLVFAARSEGEIEAQLQNTYLLYRVDGTLIGKAVPSQAGGFSETTGHLPQVQSLGSNRYAFCGQYRRIIPLGSSSETWVNFQLGSTTSGSKRKGYEARSPQDVVLTFDSDEARRTALLGETLYISGSMLMQFDGRELHEVGFLNYPFNLSIVPTGSATLNGTYNWQQTWSYFNHKGEFERSTTATIYSQAMSSDKASITYIPLHTTRKDDDSNPVTVEIWRQVANADIDADFFLTNSKDPASTGDNSHIANEPAIISAGVYYDALSDTDLEKREPYPENGGLTLENLAAPGCTIVKATQDRLFLAGIPGNPHKIVYSKLRSPGEIAAFHDILSLELPPEGGKITALEFLNETLVVFKENAIYMVSGEGYDNGGNGTNYGPGRILSSDVGAVSQEAVVVTPKGILFKSSKGWYLLNYGWAVGYAGGDVSDFDSETINSCHVMESQHQVRCVSDSRTLVWDYLADQWAEWTISSVSACVWDGAHHYVNANEDGVLAQATNHSGSGDLPQLDIETAWIKLAGLQGYSLVRYLYVLGEYLGDHRLQIRVAYDYVDTWVEDKIWTVSPASSGPLQVEHGFTRPKCEALKIRITALGDELEPPVTKALNLTGLTLEYKLKGTSYRGLPSAQKQ